jgi:hypothetical protein
MKRKWWLALALLAAGCGVRSSRPPQAIVGATLMDGSGSPPLERSVIVVEGAKIVAMGEVASTPVPEKALRFDGRGKWVFPLHPETPLAVGGPADLLLLDVNPATQPDYERRTSGRMQDGQWIQYPQ